MQNGIWAGSIHIASVNSDKGASVKHRLEGGSILMQLFCTIFAFNSDQLKEICFQFDAYIFGFVSKKLNFIDPNSMSLNNKT